MQELISIILLMASYFFVAVETNTNLPPQFKSDARAVAERAIAMTKTLGASVKGTASFVPASDQGILGPGEWIKVGYGTGTTLRTDYCGVQQTQPSNPQPSSQQTDNTGGIINNMEDKSSLTYEVTRVNKTPMEDAPNGTYFYRFFAKDINGNPVLSNNNAITVTVTKGSVLKTYKGDFNSETGKGETLDYYHGFGFLPEEKGEYTIKGEAFGKTVQFSVNVD